MTDELSPRERILQTTAELLERQGYHATGLNQIVKESASPKGSLYHYFPDGKEEIAASAIDVMSTQLAERLRTEMASIEDPAEAVRTTTLRIADHIQQSACQRGAQTAAVVLETAHTSDRLREACVLSYEARREVFEDKLLQGGFEAERANQLSVLIISAIEGAIILTRTYQSIEPLQHTAELLFRTIKNETPTT
jgi:TetR/AcrR family transcriptional regulator, lmrAB and yxaGH operons repressor